jgi:hypothetical protein
MIIMMILFVVVVDDDGDDTRNGGNICSKLSMIKIIFSGSYPEDLCGISERKDISNEDVEAGLPTSTRKAESPVGELSSDGEFNEGNGKTKQQLLSSSSSTCSSNGNPRKVVPLEVVSGQAKANS